MAKLNTADIPEGGGMQKTLQPGNTQVKILKVFTKIEPFPGDPINIVVSCEGKDLGEAFEGFAYDKDNLAAGRAKGQVGLVRAQPYTFSDGTFGGKKHNAETDMLKWTQAFCKAIGKLDWLKAQHDKHETVNDLLNQMNIDKPYDGVWVDVCLGGKAYTNKQGFINYDLFFPWFNANSVPVELPGTSPSKLYKFTREMHIIQPKAKEEVASFEGRKPKSGGPDIEL